MLYIIMFFTLLAVVGCAADPVLVPPEEPELFEPDAEDIPENLPPEESGT